MHPVSEQTTGQQGQRRTEQLQAAGDAGEERGTGDAEGHEGEDEHADPRAELADGLADPQDGEVVVVAELSEAGHVRNNKCALLIAQLLVRNSGKMRTSRCAILVPWLRDPSCSTPGSCGRSPTRCATGSSP